MATSNAEKDIDFAIKKAEEFIQSGRKRKMDERVIRTVEKLNKASDLDPRHLDEPTTI